MFKFKNRLPWLSFAVCLALLLTACSDLTQKTDTTSISNDSSIVQNDSTTENIAVPKRIESKANEAIGNCINPYYPINPKQGREYRITTSTDGSPVTYVLEQSYNGGDTFLENRDFSSGTKVINNWLCTDEGIRNVEYNNRMSISVPNAKNVNFELDTLESSGVSLPGDDWSVGKKWTANYKITSNLKAGPISAKADGTILINYVITATDQTIIVPGGEFHTARVDSTIQMNLQMKGSKMPSSTIEVSTWYAPEIGLIKQIAKTQFGTETVEYIGLK